MRFGYLSLPEKNSRDCGTDRPELIELHKDHYVSNCSACINRTFPMNFLEVKNLKKHTSRFKREVSFQRPSQLQKPLMAFPSHLSKEKFLVW
jgi:hypothetical protein